MKTNSSTTNETEALLAAVVKNLEKRWGLTLASFLPLGAHGRILQLQREISRLIVADSAPSLRQGRFYIEFYEPQHFHCTHLTLTRSDPSGPVRVKGFVKESHTLFELFRMIKEVTSRIGPLKAQLNRLTMKYGEFGIVLLGECVGKDSISYRRTLIELLNEALPKAFNISPRSWDADPSKFPQLHSALGYVKRPVPNGYDALIDQIKHIEFDPILFTLESITLVHHRHRSLAVPQQGSVTFPLGKTLEMAEDEFIQNLNLTP
jgi:hypothetical protein